MRLEQVVERFGLGALTAEPVKVAGGLSNEMWRVATAVGEFAVKRMVVNAGLPQFVGNVEGAFLVERRAWVAGVAMPEPIADPGTGRALVRVDGELFRMHRWVDGQAAAGPAAQGAELLASIHSAGEPRWEAASGSRGADSGCDGPGCDGSGWDGSGRDGSGWDSSGWDGSRWGGALARLGERVSRGPNRMLMVDSHRDLDRKNALVREDGQVLALDWDAAGPIGAVHEVVALALDWSDRYGHESEGMFVEAITAYRRRTGLVVPAEPWVFGGWVAAAGGWLDYNADHRAGDQLGQAEIAATRERMLAIADGLDDWLGVLGGG